MPEGCPLSRFSTSDLSSNTGPDQDGVVSAVPAFFPSAEARKQVDDWLTNELALASERVKSGRVSPQATVQDFSARLEAFDFSRPLPSTSVLAWIIGNMIDGIVHVDHPRYFGLFNPAPTFPSQCSDRIASTFNPQLATATTSPFPVALEAFLIRALGHRLGMPSGASGHFTNGGSEANATAVICALTRASPDFATAGARAFSGQPRLYTSEAAHLAWLKIAHNCGIGRSAICLVPTDGHGRMDANQLAASITQDIKCGAVPILIASTAGTTGAGMVDPLGACSEIAKQHMVWYHVDAAWGGALMCSEKLRGALSGIEAADSITVDGHKFLATTMGCGIFLTPHASTLSAAFHVTMDCMPSNTAEWDPYVRSMQWSRRFIGLRLFTSLATAGWQGYAYHVERAVALTQMLKIELIKRGWVCLNDSPMAVLCMRPPAGAASPTSIAQSVVAGGSAWISTVDFEGQSAVRFCITSGETTPADLADLIRSLDNAA